MVARHRRRNGPRRRPLCSDAASDTAGRVRLPDEWGRITACCLAVGLALVVGLGSLWLPAVGAKTTQELQQDLGVTRDRRGVRRVSKKHCSVWRRRTTSRPSINRSTAWKASWAGDGEGRRRAGGWTPRRLNSIRLPPGEATRRSSEGGRGPPHQQTVLNQRLVSAYKSTHWGSWNCAGIGAFQ